MINEKNQNTDNEGMVDMTVNGITMSTKVTSKYLNRPRWSKPDEKQVVSFIPGTIRELFVKEGDVVGENDRLLILEAMKMMNVILSPVKGTVKSVHIRTGDKIAKGKVMIEFE